MRREAISEFGVSQESSFEAPGAKKIQGTDWRAPFALLVFKATDDTFEMGWSNFFEYFYANTLGGERSFHCVKQMENGVVDMGLGLLNVPVNVQGFITTGGIESIAKVAQICRDLKRAKRSVKDLGGDVAAIESVRLTFEKAARPTDPEAIPWK